MELVIFYASGFALLIAACAWLEMHMRIRHENKAIASAPKAPVSRKHVRHMICSDTIKVAYYNETGRKVTTRRYPIAQYRAVLTSARAKGYRVI